MLARLRLSCLVLLLSSCRRSVPEVGPAAFPALTVEQASLLVPAQVPQREAWAKAAISALEAIGVSATPPALCQVFAIIEQESGFNPNPAVPDLSRLVRSHLEAYAAKLGPLGRPALHELLKGKARGTSKTFEERIATLRTERDLDLLFRDLLVYYKERFPGTYAAVDLLGDLFTSRSLEDLNPVTTSGSMQVSVRFAQERDKDHDRPVEKIRDELYTLEGGVLYGTARLLDYEAAYPEPLYRFADYNSGFYSSRNAALQTMLARLTGSELVPDGDLLAYDPAGEPLEKDSNTLIALLAFRKRYTPTLPERKVRREVEQEKTFGFEATETYRTIRRTFEVHTGAAAPYAQLPDVSLHSPKMQKPRTTAWFARSVQARYEKCLSRAGAP